VGLSSLQGYIQSLLIPIAIGILFLFVSRQKEKEKKEIKKAALFRSSLPVKNNY
jgi:hypothetical protein